MMILGKNVPMPESPEAKFWSWVLGIVIGTAAAVFWVTGYVMPRAEAMEKLQEQKAEYTAQIAQLNAAQLKAQQDTLLQIEYSADQNAKRVIDNQLFQLEQIPPQQMRPQDRAVYSKLLRDRQELVNLWNRRGRPLR